jgi:teichuronic acid biosynthesis glycosyltransferase TuaG
MQNEIEVSVVMPVYNCEAYIRQAVRSVLEQEVPLELIVIDDGSKDGTAEIMQDFLVDDRVIYLKNETNMGVAATRNRGVREAKGSYVAFLDADDYWRPNKLARQLALIKEKQVVLCATGRELVDREGNPLNKVIPVKEEIVYKDMLKQNWINNSSILVKRDVLLEFPMEADEIHEDYLLWLKVLRKYGRACAINEPLLVYRWDTDSKSGNKLKSAKMTYLTYRKLGMNRFQAGKSFLSYAFAGIQKYYVK